MLIRIRNWFNNTYQIFIFNTTKNCDGRTGYNEECGGCNLYDPKRQQCNF